MKSWSMVTALLLASATVALADETPVNVRGTITAISGDTVTVGNTGGSTQNITVPSGARVSYVVKAKLTDVAAGGYIGATAVPQPDGTWKALEVHILPAGTGIGSRPYDLAPQSTMTNGTITKADAAKVDALDGRVLTVDYQSGTKQIVVGPSTPVVSFAPADHTALTVGAHVFIAATRGDGGLTAQRVSVGKDGLVPPM